jgi:hypothetical protein
MRGRSFVGSDRSRIRVLGRSESGASRGRRRCWSRRVGLPLAAVVGGPGAVGRPGASVTVPGPTGRHRSGALAPAPEASIAETPPFPVELPPLADVVAGPCLHVELSVVRSHAMSSCRRCAARSASTVSNDSRSSSFVNSAWTCPRRHLPTAAVVVVGAAQRGGGAGGTAWRWGWWHSVAVGLVARSSERRWWFWMACGSRTPPSRRRQRSCSTAPWCARKLVKIPRKQTGFKI